MDDTPLPLPFEPRLLVPLINAWHTASADLPPAHRAARAAEILKEWGYTLSADVIAAFAEDYREVLRLHAPTPPPLSSRQLVPADRVCCVCEGNLVSFIRPTDACTAWQRRESLLRWETRGTR